MIRLSPSILHLSRYKPLQGAWDLVIWAKYFAVAVLVLCILGVVSIHMQGVISAAFECILAAAAPAPSCASSMLYQWCSTILTCFSETVWCALVCQSWRGGCMCLCAVWTQLPHAMQPAQDARLPLPLHHRTHSIEGTPDDPLSPRTRAEEAKATTLFEAPAHNPLLYLPSAGERSASCFPCRDKHVNLLPSVLTLERWCYVKLQ